MSDAGPRADGQVVAGAVLALALLAACGPRVDVVAELPADAALAGSCPGASPVLYRPKTPDVVIAFDASASMQKAFGAGTRLSALQATLRELVQRFEARIRWGYQEFPRNTSAEPCPDGESCCAGEVAVSPVLNGFAAIDRAMAPCGGASVCSTRRVNTPTADALRLLRAFYARLNDAVDERYVLLATDGEPNCAPGGQDPCAAAESEARALLAAGVKTVVLGVSEEVAGSACLGRLALAGGAARPGGPPHHYPGSDPALLASHLTQIVDALARPSCLIELQDPAADPGRLALFFDRRQVPRDPAHVDGWDFADGSDRRLLLYGRACAELEEQRVSRIDLRAGCAPCVAGGGVCAGLLN